MVTHQGCSRGGEHPVANPVEESSLAQVDDVFGILAENVVQDPGEMCREFVNPLMFGQVLAVYVTWLDNRRQ